MGLKALVDGPKEACNTPFMKDKKRPTDVNQLAKMLVEMVTGPHENEAPKKPNAAKSAIAKKATKSETKPMNKKGISKKIALK